LKAAGIAQNSGLFSQILEGKDDLRVGKDHFDAVFFLSVTRQVRESFCLTNIDKWKCKGDNLILFNFLKE
jgi:hypothetical protein